MIDYTHISPDGVITSGEIHAEHASKMIGDRVLVGFSVVQRYLEDREGRALLLAYFQSEITGKVWAIYADQE